MYMKIAVIVVITILIGAGIFVVTSNEDTDINLSTKLSVVLIDEVSNTALSATVDVNELSTLEMLTALGGSTRNTDLVEHNWNGDSIVNMLRIWDGIGGGGGGGGSSSGSINPTTHYHVCVVAETKTTINWNKFSSYVTDYWRFKAKPGNVVGAEFGWVGSNVNLNTGFGIKDKIDGNNYIKPSVGTALKTASVNPYDSWGIYFNSYKDSASGAWKDITGQQIIGMQIEFASTITLKATTGETVVSNPGVRVATLNSNSLGVQTN